MYFHLPLSNLSSFQSHIIPNCHLVSAPMGSCCVVSGYIQISTLCGPRDGSIHVFVQQNKLLYSHILYFFTSIYLKFPCSLCYHRQTTQVTKKRARRHFMPPHPTPLTGILFVLCIHNHDPKYIYILLYFIIISLQ